MFFQAVVVDVISPGEIDMSSSAWIIHCRMALSTPNYYIWDCHTSFWQSLRVSICYVFLYFRDQNQLMWPIQQHQQSQPSVSVVTTVWGVASTTSQAQLPTDNMLPSIPTSNTGNVMNQQGYGNPGMMNAGNKPYQQSGMRWPWRWRWSCRDDSFVQTVSM